MYFLLTILYNNIPSIFAILTSVAVGLLMTVLKIPTISFASNIGSYFSVLVGLGFSIRGYISGISSGSKDYEESDADKNIITAIGNVLIIIGFVFSINNFICTIFILPLIFFHIYKGITTFQPPIFGFNDYSWSSILFWKRSWMLLLFLVIIGIMSEYISLKNGGIPSISILV